PYWEAIEKAETGDSVEDGYRGDAHNPEILRKTERGNLHNQVIERKRTGVSSSEGHGHAGEATAEEAIVFVQNEIDSGVLRPGAGIGEQHSGKWLTARGQREKDLEARSTVLKRPLHARHLRQPPDVVDFVVIPARFDPKALPRITLGLPKLTRHFIEIVGDRHDLAVADADEFVRIRRARIPLRFLINLARQVAIEVFHSVADGHGCASLFRVPKRNGNDRILAHRVAQ